MLHSRVDAQVLLSELRGEVPYGARRGWRACEIVLLCLGLRRRGDIHRGAVGFVGGKRR